MQDLIDNGVLQDLTKPSIRKNPLPDYRQAPPLYQNWVQINKIEWDCSKLIETVEVNGVEVQGIWDKEDEVLKNAVAVWGTLPRGITKLKKKSHKGQYGKHYEELETLQTILLRK